DQVQALGSKQVLSAPRSPWQRAYVERLIGTIRRECLDHRIVFSERCLYRHLPSFTEYYHRSRTHLALGKDSPEPRPIQRQTLDASSQSRRLVDCIIATSGALPKRRCHSDHVPLISTLFPHAGALAFDLI